MNAKALKLAVGLIILGLLFWKFDTAKIFDALRHCDPLYLLIALLITPVTMDLRAMRLRKLLAMHTKATPPLYILNELGYIGFLFGLVTPSRAGEFFRAYYLSRDYKISYAHSVASVFIDRMLDVAMLFILVDIAVLYFPYMLGREVLGDYTWVLAVSTALFVLLAYLLTRPRFLKKAIDYTEKAFRRMIKKDPHESKKAELSEDFHETLMNLKENKKAFIPLWANNMVLWFFVLLQAYVILLALGERVDIIFVFLAVPFAIMASLLPITVSGLGTRDLAMVALFSFAGVSASKAISLSLLYLFLGQVVPAAVGEYFYIKRGYASKSK